MRGAYADRDMSSSRLKGAIIRKSGIGCLIAEMKHDKICVEGFASAAVKVLF